MRSSPGGPDQEIGIGPVCGVEMAGHGLLVDRRGIQPPGRRVLGQQPGRPGDLGAGSVGDADVQGELVTAGRLLHDPVDGGAGARTEAIEIAQHGHRHALGAQFPGFPRDVFLQQRHEGADLLGRALPVLLAEREEREDLHPGRQRALDHFPHRLHPGLVPQGARQGASAGPAPVAVHDDGDMGRHGAVHADTGEEVVSH